VLHEGIPATAQTEHDATRGELSQSAECDSHESGPTRPVIEHGCSQTQACRSRENSHSGYAISCKTRLRDPYAFITQLFSHLTKPHIFCNCGLVRKCYS